MPPARINPRRFSSLSAAAQADELGLGADVVLHGAFDVGFDGAGLEVKFRIEGVELEEIAMRPAGWRTGTTVAEFVEIVTALVGAVGELLPVGDVFREFASADRQVVENPMDPSAGGGVRIVHDEREGLRGGGRIVPGELGRNVKSVAGECLGDRLAGRERVGGKLEGYGRS